jgi:hypothetical protein
MARVRRLAPGIARQKGQVGALTCQPGVLTRQPGGLPGFPRPCMHLLTALAPAHRSRPSAAGWKRMPKQVRRGHGGVRSPSEGYPGSPMVVSRAAAIRSRELKTPEVI